MVSHRPSLRPAATTIVTPLAGLQARAITIAGPDGGEIPTYAAPAGSAPSGGLPVVLVVQEVFGVHEHIKDIVRRLAQAGYLAVAVEHYHRHGDPSRLASLEEIRFTIVSRVSDAEVLADLDAAAAWAGQHGGDIGRLAVTGFCWGGRIAWLYAAHREGLRATVAWYGRLTGERTPLMPRHPVDVAGALRAPVLGLYGGADQGIPLSTVDELRRWLSDGDAPRSQVVVYPEAPHAEDAPFSWTPAI